MKPTHATLRHAASAALGALPPTTASLLAALLLAAMPAPRAAAQSPVPGEQAATRSRAPVTVNFVNADVDAVKELVRVLRPGGTMAISVPRWLPEVINWRLSDDYHNAEGGHIRIYTDHELIDKVTKAGRPNDGTPGQAMIFEGKDYAHGLHAPYWWIKSAVGVSNDEHFLARTYHKLLVWEIMKQPKLLQYASRVLDPVIGKSMVLYFRKPDEAAA